MTLNRRIRRLRRFLKANKGIAALEFAMIAPMMIFLLFGSVEMIGVLEANSRAQNVSSALADVVSRDTEVSNAEVAGFWDALEVLMYPNDSAGLDVRITSIRIVNATSAVVVWSEARGMSPLTANSPITLNAAMMTPGSSLIMAETAYSYESPLGLVLSKTMNLSHVAYRRSRLVDPIPRIR